MATLKFKFDLRDTVKDQITGYEGVVIGVTRWYNGCTRYGVKSQKLKDNKPMDSEWFDEQELDLVKKAEEMKEKKKASGGPMPDPKLF